MSSEKEVLSGKQMLNKLMETFVRQKRVKQQLILPDLIEKRKYWNVRQLLITFDHFVHFYSAHSRRAPREAWLAMRTKR